MPFILKLIQALVFWGIFSYVVFYVPYPESITQANFIQLISFFIPLYLALSFSLNIFLKNILISSSISLGLICILILKALDSLNLVTTVLTAVSIYLLVSYFRKNKRGLTSLSKIPKLTTLRRRKR